MADHPLCDERFERLDDAQEAVSATLKQHGATLSEHSLTLAGRERQQSPIRMAGAEAPEQGYRLDYSFQNYDPDRPTALEAEAQRASQTRARWLASQLAGKTPEEAYVLIENALTNATTVAQMRQVLTQLLPVIGSGLVYLGRNLDE